MSRTMAFGLIIFALCIGLVLGAQYGHRPPAVAPSEAPLVQAAANLVPDPPVPPAPHGRNAYLGHCQFANDAVVTAEDLHDALVDAHRGCR